MAKGKPKNDVTDPPVSVLDQTEPEIPVMGIGEVIEEKITPWDQEAILAEEQMAGDITKMVMERIKTLPSPWSSMTPNQQTDVLASVSAGCASITGKAIEIIASRGRRIIKGSMKQATIKDEIQLTIICQRSPEACAAMGMAAAGGEVAFLLLDTDGLMELGSPIEVDKVQGELDLDFGPEDGETPNSNDTQSTTTEACPL